MVLAHGLVNAAGIIQISNSFRFATILERSVVVAAEERGDRFRGGCQVAAEEGHVRGKTPRDWMLGIDFVQSLQLSRCIRTPAQRHERPDL